MRAQDFINEIEALGPMSGLRWLPKKTIHRGLKPIDRLPEISYKVVQTKKDSGPTVLLYDPTAPHPKPVKSKLETGDEFQQRFDNWNKNKSGKVIGSLSTSSMERFPIKGAVRVNTIAVDPNYRNKGLAQFMYNVIINELKLTLVAGSAQSPGGRAAWLELAKNPNVNVMGYYSVEESAIDENPKLIDQIMTLGGQALGKPYKTKWGTDYFFVFPLKFGRERLNPLMLNKLSQIYGDDEFGTGLYAYAAGQTASRIKEQQ
jgi:ribosomal protein S18 acetylase RimI-like enzyme